MKWVNDKIMDPQVERTKYIGRKVWQIIPSARTKRL